MTDKPDSPWPDHIEASKWMSGVEASVLGEEGIEMIQFVSISSEDGFYALYKSICEGLEEIDIDSQLPDELAETLLLYFLTANALLEGTSIELLTNRLRDGEKVRYETLKQFIEDDLTQADRENLLYSLGEIDEGLKGEMRKTTRIRNEFAHNPASSLTPAEDIHTLKADVGRAHRAVQNLKEHYHTPQKSRSGNDG